MRKSVAEKVSEIIGSNKKDGVKIHTLRRIRIGRGRGADRAREMIEAYMASVVDSPAAKALRIQRWEQKFRKNRRSLREIADRLKVAREAWSGLRKDVSSSIHNAMLEVAMDYERVVLELPSDFCLILKTDLATDWSCFGKAYGSPLVTKTHCASLVKLLSPTEFARTLLRDGDCPPWRTISTMSFEARGDFITQILGQMLNIENLLPMNDMLDMIAQLDAHLTKL